LTIGELAGLVPSSLLVNVDFEKFSKENGFEPIDMTQNLKIDKKLLASHSSVAATANVPNSNLNNGK